MFQLNRNTSSLRSLTLKAMTRERLATGFLLGKYHGNTNVTYDTMH